MNKNLYIRRNKNKIKVLNWDKEKWFRRRINRSKMVLAFKSKKWKKTFQIDLNLFQKKQTDKIFMEKIEQELSKLTHSELMVVI